MDIDLTINNSYSKEEIEAAFSTNFGARIKGITLRRWHDDTPYIILFSRSDGPYSDNIEGNTFYYDGEGLEGDQKLTAANNALIKANIDKRLIFGFHQDSANSGWKYLGLIDVVNYDYVSKNGRKVYEFKLKINDIENPQELTEEEVAIKTQSILSEPTLLEENESRLTLLKRKYRNTSFRLQVKEIYKNTCAVCNKSRYTNANYPEVEAAHIFPVEKNGANDLRNGIALCRLHHWAFDGGLFTINDDLSISVKNGLIGDTNYDEITKFDAKKITPPVNIQYAPHPIYLRQHRILHGFEND